MIILYTNATDILTVCLNKNIRHVMSYIHDLLIKSQTYITIDMHFFTHTLSTYTDTEYDSTCTSVHSSNIYSCDSDIRNVIYKKKKSVK